MRRLLVLAFLVCASCETLTRAGIALGFLNEPEEGALVRAAKAVDSAAINWLWSLLGIPVVAQAHPKVRRATVAAAKATGRVILRKPPPHKPAA